MAVYNRTFSTILSGNLKPIVDTSHFSSTTSKDNKSTSIRFDLKPVKENIKDPGITAEPKKKAVCDYIANIIGDDKVVFHVGMFQSYLVDIISKNNDIDVLIDYDYDNTAVLDYLSNKDEVRLYIGKVLYTLDNITIFYKLGYDYIIVDDYKGDEFSLVKILQWCKEMGKKVISINNKRILGYFNKTIIKENIVEGYTITTLSLK